MRRIGVLANLAEDDPEDRKRVEAFLQALQKLGWREGDNLQIDYRHADPCHWFVGHRRVA
jgi:hypothetical protein